MNSYAIHAPEAYYPARQGYTVRVFSFFGGPLLAERVFPTRQEAEAWRYPW